LIRIPYNFTEDDARQVFLQSVSQTESSDLPLNFYIPTGPDVPGGFIRSRDEIQTPMVIEAKSYPGAVIAYMDRFESSGMEHDDSGRFLGWDNLHTIIDSLILTPPEKWTDLLVGLHDADLREVEPQNIARFRSTEYIKSTIKS